MPSTRPHSSGSSTDLGSGHLGFGQREQLPLAIALGDERLECLRETVRGAALGND